jgi:hypothetical protein
MTTAVGAGTRVESDRLRNCVQAIMARDHLTLQAMADRLSLPVVRMTDWLGGETLPGRQQRAVRIALGDAAGAP